VPSSSSARASKSLIEIPVSHRFKVHSTYSAVLFVIIACLTYLYRLGGFVDGFDVQARNESLRDYRVWISAGESLWHGKNPFVLNEILKSGIFSSQTIFFLRQMFPNSESFFLTFQLLNLLALLFFLWQNKLLTKQFTFIAYVLLFSSSTREILVNGQITGLILGVFALLQRFLATSNTGIYNNRLYPLVNISKTFMCGFATFFLLDIKPNVTLIPVLILILYTRNFSAFVIGFVLWFSHLFFASLIVGDNLLLSWYQNLTNVTSYEKNSDLFGSLGIWQILNTLSLSPTLFEILPVLSFLLIGIFAKRFLRKGRIEIALLFAFLANYFYTYFHFYSFFPILSFIFYELLRNRNFFALGLSISSMFLSFNSELDKTTMLSMGFLIAIVLFFRFEKTVHFVSFSFGWVMFLSFKWLIDVLIGLEQLQAKALISAIPVLTYLMIGTIVKFRTSTGDKN
jgi:hypothetical protein